MSRTLVPAILRVALAGSFVVLLCGLAGSAGAQPFALVYASSNACDLSATPPENFQSSSGAQPVLPPVVVPVGQSVTLDLCFLIWPEASTTTGIVCTNGDGTHSCAEQAKFITNGGIEVTAFTPVGPDGEDQFPKYEARVDSTSLKIAGGHPILGRRGNGLVGLRWGTVTLAGVAPAGVFELTSLGGYVDEAFQRRDFPTTVVATTINNCGNSLLDAGEECEDGNQEFGDGCAPNCRRESSVALEGAMGPPGTTGSLGLEIDGVPVTLDLSTLPNAPASEVIQALVVNVNDEPLLAASAAQVDDPSQPAGNQSKLVTDGVFTEEPVLQLSAGTLQVPEPGFLVLLGSGLALLVAMAGRRAGR